MSAKNSEMKNSKQLIKNDRSFLNEIEYARLCNKLGFSLESLAEFVVAIAVIAFRVVVKIGKLLFVKDIIEVDGKAEEVICAIEDDTTLHYFFYPERGCLVFPPPIIEMSSEDEKKLNDALQNVTAHYRNPDRLFQVGLRIIVNIIDCLAQGTELAVMCKPYSKSVCLIIIEPPSKKEPYRLRNTPHEEYPFG